jgi:hypothetical protein
MPLAQLLNQPKTDAEWSLWAWSHKDQHDLIRQAIQTKYNVNLDQYVLQPINLDEPALFLDNNQQAHDDFNGVLGTRGSDLLQVDLNNPAQFQSWINLHYQEHYTASAALKVT